MSLNRLLFAKTTTERKLSNISQKLNSLEKNQHRMIPQIVSVQLGFEFLQMTITGFSIGAHFKRVVFFPHCFNGFLLFSQFRMTGLMFFPFLRSQPQYWKHLLKLHVYDYLLSREYEFLFYKFQKNIFAFFLSHCNISMVGGCCIIYEPHFSNALRGSFLDWMWNHTHPPRRRKF